MGCFLLDLGKPDHLAIGKPDQVIKSNLMETPLSTYGAPMRCRIAILPPTIALALLFGCASHPSEAFLDLVKKDRVGTVIPEITVHLGKVLDERTFADDKESSLRKAMEILGNRMGFRIEASKGGSRYMPAMQYTLADQKDPGLPGVSISRNGDVVKITPDYRRDLIIEAATTPRDGFEKLITTVNSSQDKATATAMLALFGDKDAKGTVTRLEEADKETRNKKARAFEANVERVRKDSGYAKAWFITYRLKQSSALPEDSPFWSLADALARARTKDVIEKNPAYLASSNFWTAHGKQDTKATLVTYSVVAFQDAKGGLAKTEGWQAFKGE
jgi:hypothetical protein